MAIVSCPECNKKLKVADTSVGKKVKCSCGNIFVAQAEAPAAPVEAAPMAPEKVFVACTECGAKLKVATTSLGKKMKCPKCASVFVAQVQEETPPPPPPEPEPELADDDDPPPMAKPIKKLASDDDDLMNFIDDDEPKPKGKARPVAIEDDDDDMPKPKAKPGKKPTKSADADAGGKPVYPSRILQNILVTLMLLFMTAVFAVMFFGQDFEIDLAKMVGIPPAKGVREIRNFKGGKDDDKAADGNKDAKKDKDIDKDKAGPDKPGKSEKDKDKAADKLDKDDDKDAKKENGKSSDRARADAAAARLKVLTQATQAYFIRNQKFPQSLSQLVERDDFGTQYIENKNNLLDPWKKPYQYDPTGQKNLGLKPDIWTVTPSKEIIGNWPANPSEKKDDDKDKGADKDKGKNGKGAASYSRIGSINNLKQMGLAIHFYHDANKNLPPAGISDETGKPLLSWRVAILPYIEENELYQQFDLTKAWDDPHNKKLIAKMPKLYIVPGIDAKEGLTHYRTLIGPGTPLEPLKGAKGKLIGRTLLTIPDGTSNVIMVVEAKDPTIWTRPDDLVYDPKGPLPKFGVAPAGFAAVFGDGFVRFINAKVNEDVLRPYFTCQNGIPRQPLDEGK